MGSTSLQPTNDPLGEEFETTVWAAADLGDTCTAGHPDLIKKPARLMRELLRLLLQPLLFRLSVAENVLIGLGHDGSPLLLRRCAAPTSSVLHPTLAERLGIISRGCRRVNKPRVFARLRSDEALR
jgi:hypothetical protein